jgi:putative sigma-54 modulation protein
MDIRISAQRVTVTPAIREHLDEKLSRLDKYAPRLVESHVILKKEKYVFVAEMTLLAKNLKAYGEGSSSENVYAAIELAYERIVKQLKRFREKLKDHHKRVAGKPFRRAAEEARAERAPSVIRSRGFSAEPMSPEDASLELRLSGKPFLVFQNASTQQVNVIFKRDDGHHGLVEPDS